MKRFSVTSKQVHSLMMVALISACGVPDEATVAIEAPKKSAEVSQS